MLRLWLWFGNSTAGLQFYTLADVFEQVFLATISMSVPGKADIVLYNAVVVLLIYIHEYLVDGASVSLTDSDSGEYIYTARCPPTTEMGSFSLSCPWCIKRAVRS